MNYAVIHTDLAGPVFVSFSGPYLCPQRETQVAFSAALLLQSACRLAGHFLLSPLMEAAARRPRQARAMLLHNSGLRVSDSVGMGLTALGAANRSN